MEGLSRDLRLLCSPFNIVELHSCTIQLCSISIVCLHSSQLYDPTVRSNCALEASFAITVHSCRIQLCSPSDPTLHCLASQLSNCANSTNMASQARPGSVLVFLLEPWLSGGLFLKKKIYFGNKLLTQRVETNISNKC